MTKQFNADFKVHTIQHIAVNGDPNGCHKNIMMGYAPIILESEYHSLETMFSLPEAKYAGAYILLTGDRKIYIGEATDVAHRLRNHSKLDKDALQILAITGRELDKCTSSYLEAVLIQMAKQEGRYEVLNIQEPDPSACVISDELRQFMDSFIEVTLHILRKMSVNIFQPSVWSTPVLQLETQSILLPEPLFNHEEDGRVLFCYAPNGAVSEGIYDPNTRCMTVQEGSEIRCNSGCKTESSELRQKLVELGILIGVTGVPDRMVFTRAYTFHPMKSNYTALSRSARIVLDRNSNGWDDWICPVAEQSAGLVYR